jgi:hypothetical protein
MIMCLLYFGQLFHLRREAGSFRNVVFRFEYYDNGEKALLSVDDIISDYLPTQH